MSLSDGATTTAVQQQNAKQLFALQKVALQRFVARQLSGAEAEDVVQEVFEEMLNAYRLPIEVEQTIAWLYTVAKNKVVDRLRKKRPVNFSDLTPAVIHDENDHDLWLDYLLPPTDDNPEWEVERELLYQALVEALNQLPSHLREVVVAHEIDGMSFKEMAGMTGISVNTLLSRKRYAIQQLRVLLSNWIEEI